MVGVQPCVYQIFYKSVKFHESQESTESSFMTTRQIGMSLRDNAQLFMVFTSLRGSERMITNMPVVHEFLEVFLVEINDLSSECKVEFDIDLVLSIGHVSMEPYRMSALEQSEMNK